MRSLLPVEFQLQLHSFTFAAFVLIHIPKHRSVKEMEVFRDSHFPFPVKRKHLSHVSS